MSIEREGEKWQASRKQKLGFLKALLGRFGQTPGLSQDLNITLNGSSVTNSGKKNNRKKISHQKRLKEKHMRWNGCIVQPELRVGDSSNRGLTFRGR